MQIYSAVGCALKLFRRNITSSVKSTGVDRPVSLGLFRVQIRVYPLAQSCEGWVAWKSLS